MRHILRIFFVVTTIAAFAACSSRHPEEQAAKAAKHYYEQLIKGRYDDFVESKAFTDSLPPVYREQLVENMKMFAAQMQAEHQGMRDVRIVNGVVGEDGHSANVFLAICFGDSTIEEIVVPMVEQKGKWKMK